MDIFNAISTVTDFFTPDINYTMLQNIADYKEIQGEALELQVEQEANLMREQFLESIGAYQASATQRGVKVSEGSVQQNIEMSAGNLGKDIQTAKDNVQYKKKQLKSSAKQYRATAQTYQGLEYTEDFIENFGSQKGKKKTTKKDGVL